MPPDGRHGRPTPSPVPTGCCYGPLARRACRARPAETRTDAAEARLAPAEGGIARDEVGHGSQTAHGLCEVAGWTTMHDPRASQERRAGAKRHCTQRSQPMHPRNLECIQVVRITSGPGTAPHAQWERCLSCSSSAHHSSTLGTAQQRDDLVCPPVEPRTRARMAYEPATTASSRPRAPTLECAPRRDLGRRVEPGNCERRSRRDRLEEQRRFVARDFRRQTSCLIWKSSSTRPSLPSVRTLYEV